MKLIDLESWRMSETDGEGVDYCNTLTRRVDCQ